MDEQLWNSLKKIEADNPSSFGAFVELTLPRVFASRDGDERLTLVAYQRIGPYLAQLRRGDDFWAWFEQLCGGKPEEEWSEESPGAELAEKARVVASSAEPARFLGLRRVLVGSVLSGFVPSLLAFFSLIFWCGGFNSLGVLELDAELVISALLMGLLMAAAFVVGVAPWVAGWRRSFLLGPPALMVPLTAVGFAAVLPFLARPWLVLAGDRLDASIALAPLIPWEVALMMIPDVLIEFARALKPVTFWAGVQTVPCWIYGFAFVTSGLFLWFCQALVKANPWVVHHRVGRWRKVFSLMILIPLSWQAMVVANIYLDGRRVDPSLREYLANEVPEKKPLILFTDLVNRYLQSDTYQEVMKDHRVPVGWVDGLEPDDWEPLFEAWLEVGEEIWTRPDWSSYPSVLEFGDAVPDPFSASSEKVYKRATVEATIRLGSLRWSKSSLAEVPWSQCHLTANEWEDMAKIVMEAMEAPRYPSLKESFRSSFESWEERVESGLSHSYEANRSLFDLVYHRAELNRCWRLCSQYRDRLISHEPTPRAELVALSERFRDDGWQGRPTPYVDFLHQQLRLHRLAQALIECEVRAHLVAGEPPPASFADFSPRARKLLVPMESWFHYRPFENRAELEYLGFDSVPGFREIKLR